MTNQPDHAERLAQALRSALESPQYSQRWYRAREILAAYESSKSEPQVTNSCPICDARAEGFTDAEVEAACDAYRDGTFDYTPVSHGAMRAALEAARRGGV